MSGVFGATLLGGCLGGLGRLSCWGGSFDLGGGCGVGEPTAASVIGMIVSYITFDHEGKVEKLVLERYDVADENRKLRAEVDLLRQAPELAKLAEVFSRA